MIGTTSAAGRACEWRGRLAVAVRCTIVSGVLSLAPTLAACATPAATASDQLAEIQQRLREDKARSDWQAFLIDATRSSEFVHGSPGAQLEIARAQLNLGNATAAKATVARVLAMGATHPILASPLFLPVVEALGPLRAASEKVVTSAAVALTIADRELLPEDIDFDAKRRRFFVTSIRRGEVAELGTDGTVRTFAVSPHRWPMMALKIDSRRRRLWATEAAVDGFAERRPAGDFTHGVVVEGRFYYLANAGWNSIDEKGRPKVGVEPSRPLLMVSDVPARKTRRDGGHDLDPSPNARVDVSKPRRRASST